MPSTAAIEPAYANSNHVNLVACLALYQHRQDQAVGIGWLSGRVRGLLWYYNQLNRIDLFETMTANYLNSVIQEKAAEIKLIVSVAKNAKNKHELLKQAIELEQEINIAKAMLDEFMGSRLPV